MLPDQVSNPGPLTYESGALPIALRDPCLNIEIEHRVTKYCRKEEKLLLRSNFFPFQQYFQHIFLAKGVKLHVHL